MKTQISSLTQKAATPSDSLKKNQGFVVIAALLILIVLTLIQLAMARSFWMQEIMGGNTREKARALNAAQSANRQAELWLTTTNTGKTGVSCTAGDLITAKVCQVADPAAYNPLSTTTPPLVSWTDLKNTESQLEVNSSGAEGKYYRSPGYHILYLSTSANGQARFYKVTAFGYGGNQNAVAVTQSLYQIDYSTNAKGNTVKNLGG